MTDFEFVDLPSGKNLTIYNRSMDACIFMKDEYCASHICDECPVLDLASITFIFNKEEDNESL